MDWFTKYKCCKKGILSFVIKCVMRGLICDVIGRRMKKCDETNRTAKCFHDFHCTQVAGLLRG